LKDQEKSLAEEVEKLKEQYESKLQDKLRIENELNLDRKADEEAEEVDVAASESDTPEEFAFSSRSEDSFTDVASIAHLSPEVTRKVADLIATSLGTTIRDLTSRITTEGT